MTVHYWQDRLITGALVAMETCGLALLVVTILPPPDWAGLAARALVVGVVLVATTLLARWLADAPRLPWHYYDAAALGVLVAMILLAEFALWRSRGALRFGNGGTLFGIPPTILVAVAAFVLWWRGFGLAQKGMDFAQVSLNFRLGSLLLLALTALNARTSQGYATALAGSYFVSGLVALAASRVEAKGRDAMTEQPMGPFEASLLGTISLATVGAGLLAGGILTGGGLAVLASVLRPVALAFLEALVLVAGWLAALFQPIADWLQSLIEARPEEDVTPTPLPSPLDMPNQPEPSTLSQLLGWIGTALLVILAAVIFIEFMVLLVLFLQKRSRRDKGRAGDYAAASAAADEGGNRLENLIGQIRDWAGLLLRYGLGPQLYTMLTVRTMYANLVRLAAARGFPRPPATTPTEYLTRLRHAFPNADADLEHITNAYIAVHYGELPTGDDEMQQLRAAYDRVRTPAANPSPPAPGDVGASR